MSKELIEYAKKNLKKGYKKETLKYALIKQGYPRVTVERVLEKAEKEFSQEKKLLSNKHSKKEKPLIKYELYDKDNKIVKTYDSTKEDKKKKNSSDSLWKKLLNFFR